MRIQVPVNWVWIGLDQVLDHTFSSAIIVMISRQFYELKNRIFYGFLAKIHFFQPVRNSYEAVAVKM